MCLSQLADGVLNERTYDARDRFERLFAALLNTRTLPNPDMPSVTACEQLAHAEARQLQAVALTHSKQLLDLPRHSNYSRHVIGTDGPWMGFICRWEPNTCSPVHGHPCFAYYQVLLGEFSMDLYATTENRMAKHTITQKMNDSDCIWQRGKPGCYDNFVHKVRTHETGGFTLHLFSENPSLGEHFAVIK